MGKITFLGTGTSQGIPMIGCSCKVCTSSDPKDNRLRTSALVEHNGFRILIDCGPDFRQQMLRENISDLDAVILTHQHKDHTGGLDDIRAFNYFRKEAFPIYAEEIVQESLKMEYYYAFSEYKYPGVPDYILHTIDEKPFTITKKLPDNSTSTLEITPIRVFHYRLPILGFRIGNMAYITDGSRIPEEELAKLKGVELFIINTVRHEKHISHFSLPEALEIIRKVGAPRNFLTHMSHQLGRHEELCAILPEKVKPAYDGLTLEF
ncbi:MAG: MBL fold metallo-hydrolase [Bacteroidales bacterium]|nr:MBL fold metallo-hydrolase [Bacteroidales bacterium]